MQYSSFVFFPVVTQRSREMERNGKRIFIPSVMKSMTHCCYFCARKVRGAGKQTDSDTKKCGCSILEKKRGLSPWTGKDAYVVFYRKNGCQEVLNINHRWKNLPRSKIWRLQKATISSGHQLCGFKWKEDSSSYEQWIQIPNSQR